MELPEEDKQAFIDAARRRTQPQQGGAAFGVYPSSGKRAEKLNVSRDVNMPAQVARGWAAGTLGLPGDIEGLGRTLLNVSPAGQEHERVTGKSFVSETPFLPTSDFYREYLPGYDPAPAARAASGLGALAGGAGSTKVAGAAVKGAQAAGKALGPKAAEMAEGYLQRSGLAPSVIKPKGGNWLSGSVESATEPLKPTRFGVETQEHIDSIKGTLQDNPYLSEASRADLQRELHELEPDYEVGRWIDTKLNKYIRNEMATPEDPVRKLAERGVLHFDAPTVEATASLDEKRRAFAQANDNKWAYGQSQLAQNWEDASDKMVNTLTAGKIAEMNPDMVKRNWSGLDWVYKADPETMIYGLNRGSGSPTDPSIDSLGFSHLIDELRNATRADSDLPANLRWKPEDLKKVTMEQAVERVAKINDWRAAQMAAAQKAAREGIPLHKEYEGGFQWMAAPDTAIDPKSLQYIKDVGCEGGWCTQGEDLARQYGGRGNQLYVLHEPSGKPVVQISVRPARGQDKYYTEWVKSQPESVQDEITAAAIKYNAENPKLGYGESLNKILQDRIGPMPPEIVEIKGKQNRAPKEEHLPMVQDFVRSGNWSRVGDFRNTGLIEVGEKSAVGQMLKQAGETNIPPYVTRQEYDQIIERFGMRPGFGLPEGYAKGGLVQDTDAIFAKLTGMDKDKALTQALRMANAKQEAHMAAGGLAKLLKGASKVEEAVKPAQIGNYQALPLKLPRAPNLPPQELTKTAERVARQQMGEHVRKSPTKAENLAGRSMKEVERLKNLDIELQPTKQIPTPTVVPEKKGEVRIGLPGDISITDQILMSVNNLPIGAQQEGGALYGFGKMDLPDPAFWASNRVPAQQVQNKAADVANVFDTPDVLAMHLAMGHEAMNFAQHFADANLRAIQQMPVHPESAKLFNEIVRAGNPKTGEKFPHFPGVENYEETYKALQQDPEMRKWFNNRMKVDKVTGPLGLPSGKEIEYAVMEPALSNMEPSMVGLSVGRLRPGAELIPDSAHKTYSHDIPGLALGRTQELLPIDLAFPDAAAHVRKTKRPDDFTATIQKLYPHQVVDQQYIDQVGEYYNRLRQIRGYNKGGAVKKSGLSVLNKAII